MWGEEVRWELWKPWYDKISARLNLDKRADAEAARVLNQLLPEPDIKAVAEIIRGRECVVIGAGPSLEEDLRRMEKAGYLEKILISANGATSAVIRYRNPEIVVTDLDGAVGDQLRAWRRGSWLVVHGHGDNLAQIQRHVPRIKERIIGTTQVRPFGKLFNFGGFTDGDRAAFMARELGARRIYLAGMDFGSVIGKYSGRKDKARKLLKLEVGKELIGWLSSELGAEIINLTTGGEPIPNVPRLDLA